MIDDRRAHPTVACDDVDDTGRQADVAAHLRECQGGQGCPLSGFQHHGVPHRDRRGDLPRKHQHREVPRDDLARDAKRLVARELCAHDLRPPGVVAEVPGHERDVDVPGLADGLAVVHRLEHREVAAVLLQVAGDRVEVPGALVPAAPRPRRERIASGCDRRVDVGRRRLGDLCDRLCVAGVDRCERLARWGERPADEQPKPPVVMIEPVVDATVGLRRGTVIHGVQQIPDAEGHQVMGWRKAAE